VFTDFTKRGGPVLNLVTEIAMETKKCSFWYCKPNKTIETLRNMRVPKQK